MQKLVGQEIEVYLNDGDLLGGLFFDSDDDSIYLQNRDSLVIAIPKENVKYCLSLLPKSISPTKSINLQQDSGNVLVVKIDNQIISKLPVPPEMNLATCSSEIINLAYSDEKVQTFLSNVAQKTIEYDVGEINIITTVSPVESKNVFSVSNSNDTLNPSDMVLKFGGKNK
jgi:hypothetical protein